MTKAKTNPDLWEKQEHETSKAYAAFCAYRDMGTDRSLTNIIPILYKDLGSTKTATKRRRLSEWSSMHNWVARVEAYDVYLESKLRRDNELAIEKMARRHTEASMMAVDKAVDRIKLIGEKNTEELTPKEALEYLKVAAELERKSRGAPDQLVELSGSVVQIIDDIPRGKKDESTTQKSNH